MDYKRLGSTGLKVSKICLGTMQFGWSVDEEGSHQVLDRAIELGCNFIDTADVYSAWLQDHQGGESETIIGNWLSRARHHRHNIVIATKVRGRMGSGPNDEGLSRSHIMQAVDASLQRLKTDYLDLYQVHYPDEETQLEETLRALDDLVHAGKVRYIGCSNFPAWLLTRSLWISDVQNLARFESLQPHYNYIHRAEFERELRYLCKDLGIGVIPYSPLGGGFLTGKYRRGEELPGSVRAGSVKRRYLNDRGFSALDGLESVAKKLGVTISQVAIAWLLADSVVDSVIIGANSISQLEESIGSADVSLPAGEKEFLDRLTDWNAS